MPACVSLLGRQVTLGPEASAHGGSVRRRMSSVAAAISIAKKFTSRLRLQPAARIRAGHWFFQGAGARATGEANVAAALLRQN